MEQKIKTIVITHKDCFILLWLSWFEKVLYEVSVQKSYRREERIPPPQEELVQDIIFDSPCIFVQIIRTAQV